MSKRPPPAARPVPEHPHYRVTDHGQVWSVRRRKYLKPFRDRKGYLSVTISGKTRRIHTLVLAAFVGPRPDGMETRHLNGDPADNRLVNLAYGTRAENLADSRRHRAEKRWEERRPLREAVTRVLNRVGRHDLAALHAALDRAEETAKSARINQN